MITGRRSAENGFTLVELMVAFLIFGLLASAGVVLLSVSVRAQAAAVTKLDDIGALNRLGSAMAADLGQAEERPMRDEAGLALPAFTGEAEPGADVLLRLVRHGWTNLDNAPRAELQKVEYRLTDGTLQRIAYPMIDGAAPLAAAPLLDKVADVALRYRIDGAWSDRWAGTPEVPLPQAAEVTITRRDGTRFRQLFLVGTGYHRAGMAGGNADAY
jgi:general secretion pathway protein J